MPSEITSFKIEVAGSSPARPINRAVAQLAEARKRLIHFCHAFLSLMRKKIKKSLYRMPEEITLSSTLKSPI